MHRHSKEYDRNRELMNTHTPSKAHARLITDNGSASLGCKPPAQVHRTSKTSRPRLECTFRQTIRAAEAAEYEWAYPGRDAAGAGNDLAHSAARCRPMCQPPPSGGIPALEFAGMVRHFCSGVTLTGPSRRQQRLAHGTANQGNAGRSCQSIGDVGGLTPADSALQIKRRRRSLGPIVKASGFTPLE